MPVGVEIIIIPTDSNGWIQTGVGMAHNFDGDDGAGLMVTVPS